MCYVNYTTYSGKPARGEENLHLLSPLRDAMYGYWYTTETHTAQQNVQQTMLREKKKRKKMRGRVETTFICASKVVYR